MSGLLPETKTRHEKITQSLHQGHNIVRACIPSYHIADDVVVYEVDVSNKKLRWNLWLRYEFFYVLHQMMQELVTELSSAENRVILPPFPEKRLKLFTNHFDDHFIENRRVLLNNYIQRVLQNRYLRHSEIFISFLTPPDNEELEQQNASQENNDEKDQLNHSNDNDNDNDSNNNAPDVDDEQKTSQKEPQSEFSNSQSVINHFISTKQIELEDVNEDDEITGVAIPQAQVLKHDHTIYQVHVFNCNKRKSFAEWTVLKRFTDFHAFDGEIRKVITNDYPNEVNLLPPLPPKYLKLLVDHLDQTFIEKRRLLLQCYLQRLCKYPLLRRHDYTLKFLGVYNQ